MDASFVSKAKAAWQPAPDWILALAERADAEGLKGAAAAVGYSGSLVSNVLAGKYQASLHNVERRVRGAFMGGVNCPGTGDVMSTAACLDWQQKPFEPSSQLRCRMYRACRSGCPHFGSMGGVNAR
jgi:hypothetical protein